MNECLSGSNEDDANYRKLAEDEFLLKAKLPRRQKTSRERFAVRPRRPSVRPSNRPSVRHVEQRRLKSRRNGTKIDVSAGEGWHIRCCLPFLLLISLSSPRLPFNPIILCEAPPTSPTCLVIPSSALLPPAAAEKPKPPSGFSLQETIKEC